jgi:L-aspartate oxidase
MATSTYDVIIVGAGLAGLVCADHLAHSGKSVAVIYEHEAQHTASGYAQGGIAAAWYPHDSIQAHSHDTEAAGAGLCVPDVVQFFCERGPRFLDYLIQLSVPFITNQTGYALTQEGAHSCPRIFHVNDHTGASIMDTIQRRLQKYPNITWIQDKVIGLQQSRQTGRMGGVSTMHHTIWSPAVVLATGGFSHCFTKSTNPSSWGAYGLALAAASGAALGDLEFIQFHPTVYCLDGFPPLLLSESLRGEGAFLVNQTNDRFMQRYHPLGDLAPRDVVARAIANEEGVRLDITPLRPHFSERFPTIWNGLKARGVWNEWRIPVSPVAHYTMGGIVARPNGVTTVPGLFAIGESAVTGYHGANRLASNSLLEAGVMGYELAHYLHQIPPLESITEYNPIRVSPLHPKDDRWFRLWMDRVMGVLRSKSDLTEGIRALSGHGQAQHSIFQLGVLIMRSALNRCESRGGHYRLDMPQQQAQAYHSLVTREGGIHHVPNWNDALAGFDSPLGNLHPKRG